MTLVWWAQGRCPPDCRRRLKLTVEELAGDTLEQAHEAVGGLVTVAAQLLQLWSLMKGVDPLDALGEYALVIAGKEQEG